MATMNISLPDEMKEWVDGQVTLGQYAGASDYVRDVLRRERAGLERLQALIDEGRASGVVDMTPAELFEDIKRRSRERALAMADEIRAEAVKADDAA